MTKWIWGSLIVLGATVAVAAAGLESSPIYPEYQRRTQVKYTGYAQAVLTGTRAANASRGARAG